ncbi:hypothetical protein GGR56DRAFT_673775 [Xylariaceae sp. FL0804]|nr:hypothetical protein GGR56DRAFT_673775 [Xylariaceae sp. FL0804]
MQPLCARGGASARRCHVRSKRHATTASRTICRRYASSSSSSSSSPPTGRKPAAPVRPAAKPLPFQTRPGPHRPSPPPPPPPGGGGGSSSSSSSTRSDGKMTAREWLKGPRLIGLMGMGAAAAALGLTTASVAASHWRDAPAPYCPLGGEPGEDDGEGAAEPTTGRPLLQSPADFDAHLDRSEWWVGVTAQRRRLAARARGHVLEVAVGTGRNLEFYDWAAVDDALLRPAERRRRRDEERSRPGLWTTAWRSLTGGGDHDGSESEAGSGSGTSSVLSYTGVDVSPGMLDLALQRTRQLVPHMAEVVPRRASFAIMAAGAGGDRHTISLGSGRVRLQQGDALEALPAPPSLGPSSTIATPSPSPSAASTPTATATTIASPSASSPEHYYDTILQTFGLCSVRDPVALVERMAARLRPGTGRLLLLEHGRSPWAFVNGLLDRGARGHHAGFGCWWNRDVEAISREAAARGNVPGLELVRLERPGLATLGTHVVVEMRVRDPAEPAEPTAADGADSADAGAYAAQAVPPQPSGRQQQQQVEEEKKQERELEQEKATGGGGWASFFQPVIAVSKKRDDGESKD